MPQPITDERRASIVHQYLASGLSQDAFCAHLEATEGIHLAPRTLRAWAKRIGQARHPTMETVQMISEAIERLQGVLERLQASHARAATGDASHLAARPASVTKDLKVAASPTHAEAAGTQPTGTPGGDSLAPIPPQPTAPPHAPEQPRPVRRKMGVVWVT